MINSRAGRLVRIVIGTLLVAAVSNCGLKGDLYLPEPEQAASDAAQDEATADKAVDASADASQTDESDDDDEEKTAGEQPAGATPQP
jgi:predicted small lipoprotein YifL